ncbi:MAG: succinylglutamate desuccinylase [Alphaproteobacteria bacterium]|nr:succinylglutamate desuccinylase [Alphaproteobacteria bacterium]
MPKSARRELPLPPLEVVPRDLSAFRRGNRGVDYVHTFDSGRPGKHVLINGLTHGNEFCGMTAFCHLLEHGIRPKAGKLTLSLSNVAAYQSFDPRRPFESRLLVQNFNRIWSDEILDRGERSPEYDRARELRPIFREADALLDLHSTSHVNPAMWCYKNLPRHQAAARAIGFPEHHVFTSGGKMTGPVLIEYDKFGAAEGTACGLLVECGQHFASSAGAVAIDTSLRFLAHFGAIDPVRPKFPAPKAPKLLETFEVVVVRHDDFVFAENWTGFEELEKGRLICTQGGVEVRAPEESTVLVMPTRRIVVGREGVTLARKRG